MYNLWEFIIDLKSLIIIYFCKFLIDYEESNFIISPTSVICMTILPYFYEVIVPSFWYFLRIEKYVLIVFLNRKALLY